MRCYLGLGSNLQIKSMTSGDIVQQSICMIDRLVAPVAARSSLYRTKALHDKTQPDFINAVVEVETDLPAAELLARLHDVERQFLREREKRWSARTLDIDLLVYGDHVLPDRKIWKKLEKSTDPAVTLWGTPLVPHIRMHRRGFVLLPLAEIASDWFHPVLGKDIRDLTQQLEKEEIEGIERII